MHGMRMDWCSHTDLCQNGGPGCPGTALGLLGGLQVFARRSPGVADTLGGPLPQLHPPEPCHLQGSPGAG